MVRDSPSGGSAAWGVFVGCGALKCSEDKYGILAIEYA